MKIVRNSAGVHGFAAAFHGRLLTFGGVDRAGLVRAYRSGMRVWVGEGVNQARTLLLGMLIVGFAVAVLGPMGVLLAAVAPHARDSDVPSRRRGLGRDVWFDVRRALRLARGSRLGLSTRRRRPPRQIRPESAERRKMELNGKGPSDMVNKHAVAIWALVLLLAGLTAANPTSGRPMTRATIRRPPRLQAPNLHEGNRSDHSEALPGLPSKRSSGPVRDGDLRAGAQVRPISPVLSRIV